MLKTYAELVAEKKTAGLTHEQAVAVARQQIESDVQAGLREAAELAAARGQVVVAEAVSAEIEQLRARNADLEAQLKAAKAEIETLKKPAKK